MHREYRRVHDSLGTGLPEQNGAFIIADQLFGLAAYNRLSLALRLCAVVQEAHARQAILS
jgi:hypothetical protein